MPNRYFRLQEEMRAGNWDLGDPLDAQGQEMEDPWMFTAGHPISLEGRLTVPIDEPGRRLEFCTAGVGVTPIVHVRVASLLVELAPDDVQFLPANIRGHEDQYLVLVATKLVRCIDDQASKEVQYWKPEDERPEKVGQYRSVVEMRIDRTKVGDAKVFRTWGWKIGLVVSEDIKAAMEHAGVAGAKFTEV